MFIIPCKFDKENPIIFECVQAITDHHPGDLIAIIDSDSEDKGYQKDFDSQVKFYDVKNRHYALEAYRIGYEDNQDENFFYCIHDSLIIQSNISFVEKSDFTTVRWWKSPPSVFDIDENGFDLSIWANEQMQMHLGYQIPSEYKGVFGPMFFCSRKVMEDFKNSGLFNIRPKRKLESCATERIVGIVSSKLGYDVTNSIQHEGTDIHNAVYDETFVKKIHLFRN
jgi:hypothetical protein